MPITERAGVAVGGPVSGSSAFYGQGETFALASYAVNASQSASLNGTSEQSVVCIPGVSPFIPGGVGPDALPSSTSPIATINSIRIGTGGVALPVTLAGTTISFFLRRAGAVVGGGAFAGWAQAANPAIAAYSQVVVPWLITNTALVAPSPLQTLSASVALLPLVPGDVITVSVVTTGATTIPFFTGYVDIT